MSTHSYSRLSLSIVGSIAIALWYFSIAFSSCVYRCAVTVIHTVLTRALTMLWD
jgi:hypothetical protein